MRRIAFLPFLCLVSCGSPYESPVYREDAMWLCHPDNAVDYCAAAQLDATRLLPDGSRESAPALAADTDAPFDCFYVYPTVDLGVYAENHEDFTDVSTMRVPLESQAARFRHICRVFAPLYRQATIGSYFTNGPAENEYEGVNGAVFELAYADVLDAFRHYMAQDNHGRKIVILGHSQGSMHLTRLLAEEFDDVPAMREKLVVALLVGAYVQVPDGGIIGGSFANIPLCTAEYQSGCVVAYRTYEETMPPEGNSNGPPTPGRDIGCTNPAALAGGGRATLGEAFFPLTSTGAFSITANYPTPAVVTPFAAFPSFYAAECKRDANGHSYLAVHAPADMADSRADPIVYTTFLLDPGFLGTHILDYNYGIGDLLRITSNAYTSTLRD